MFCLALGSCVVASGCDSQPRTATTEPGEVLGAPEESVITGDEYLSIIDVARSKACIDIPVHFAGEGRPIVAFSGNKFNSLEQSIENETAVTTLKVYEIDPSKCEWTTL